MAVILKQISTQSDWQTGTLTNVQATSDNKLILKNDSCLYFDGVDDYIVSSKNLDLSNTNKFTLEFWMRLPYNNNSLILLEHSTNYNYNNAFGVFLHDVGSPGCLEFLEHGSNGYNIINFQTRNDDNNWHFYSAIFDRTQDIYNKIKVYVDGILGNYYLNSTYRANNTSNYGSYPFYINSRAGSSYFVSCYMSEIRIWNYARSQSDIQQNMCKRLTGSEPGLVAYWPLNEGSGNIAYDKTSNQNNGSLTNGPTWNNSIYVFNGNRIDPNIDLRNETVILNSNISWTSNLNNQSIIIESRISTDNGNTWSSWNTCTNNSQIPSLVPGCLLQFRETLSTQNIGITPQLLSLSIEINTIIKRFLFSYNI